MAYRRYKKSYRKRTTRPRYRKRYYKRRYNRGVEYKRNEVTLANTQVPAATPVFTLLNGVKAGTGEDECIGRKFTMKQLQVRGTLYSSIDQLFRVMIVIDKQTNGAVFPIADLLTNTITNQGYINSLKQVDFARRFWVLYDRTFKVEMQTDPDGDYRTFKINRRMSIPVSKKSDAENVTDIMRNSMYMVTISQNATTQSFVAATSRLRFTDD